MRVLRCDASHVRDTSKSYSSATTLPFLTTHLDATGQPTNATEAPFRSVSRVSSPIRTHSHECAEFGTDTKAITIAMERRIASLMVKNAGMRTVRAKASGQAIRLNCRRGFSVDLLLPILKQSKSRSQ